MGTAAAERDMAAKGLGCLGKAADDEPVFILRAKDEFAPVTVMDWAERVEASSDRPNTNTVEKIREARALAYKMRVWQEEHGCKVPD
jgi:hypothetical protein